MGQIALKPLNSLLAHIFVTNTARPEAVSGTLLFASTQIEDYIGLGVIPIGFNSFIASDLSYYMADDDDSNHLIRLTLELMRINDGVKPQVAAFGTVVAVTDNIPGSAGGAGGWGVNGGERTRVNITPNSGGLVEGDNFIARIRRTPGTGGDNSSGDLKLMSSFLNYS